MGFSAILIFGDPRFYSKVGFRCTEKYDIRTSHGKYAVCLLARVLRPGALDGICNGKFVESATFSCCEDASAVEMFDSEFPYREKISDTPSQRVFQILRTLQY